MIDTEFEPGKMRKTFQIAAKVFFPIIDNENYITIFNQFANVDICNKHCKSLVPLSNIKSFFFFNQKELKIQLIQMKIMMI